MSDSIIGKSKYCLILLFVIVLVSAASLFVEYQSSSDTTSSATIVHHLSTQQQQQQQEEAPAISSKEQRKKEEDYVNKIFADFPQENNNMNMNMNINHHDEFSFFRFVTSLLQEHSGPLWNNVLDPLVLHNNNKFDSNTGHFYVPCGGEEMSWNMSYGLGYIPKTPPTCMKDLKSCTKTTQFLLSLGISKMALDLKFGLRYNKLLNKGEYLLHSSPKSAEQRERLQHVKRQIELFELSVAKYVGSVLAELKQALQLCLDAFFDNSTNKFNDTTYSSHNPALADIFKELDQIRSRVQETNKKYYSFYNNNNNNNKKQNLENNNLAVNWLRRKSRLIRLFTPRSWYHQGPLNGVFWNRFRPVLQCDSVDRGSEMVDGGRFMCNAQYAFTAPYHSENAIERELGFEIVGFGSENNFEWEESLLEDLEHAKGAANLRSLTVFDCTLTGKNGRPNLDPPASVKNLKERFRFGWFCLGYADASLDIGDSQKEKLTEIDWNSDDVWKTAMKSISFAELRPFLEFKDEEMFKNKSLSMVQYSDASSAKVKLQELKKMARHIHLLKYDTESFEFLAVPRWLQLELYQIDQHVHQKQKQKQEEEKKNDNNNNNSKKLHDQENIILIDFDVAPFLNVDHVQVELHRRGGLFGENSPNGEKSATAENAIWFLWDHLLHFSLGLSHIYAEKNFASHCCYEFVYVSYRYFVESEMGMKNLL